MSTPLQRVVFVHAVLGTRTHVHKSKKESSHESPHTELELDDEAGWITVRRGNAEARSPFTNVVEIVELVPEARAKSGDRAGKTAS